MATVTGGKPLVLDCRRVREDRLGTAVREAFDGLESGERIRLECLVAPVAALTALERERPHAFEWLPLAEGPTEWRVEIERRDPEPGRPRTVREAMAWSHGRIEELEEAAFAARHAHRYAEARSTFARFAHALRRYIEVEEHLVLPEFDARCGIAPELGPSAVIRAEHRAMSAMIDLIASEIGDPQAPVELTRAELRTLLRDHHLKEDHVLYPALDRLLSEEESEALVRRARSLARR